MTVLFVKIKKIKIIILANSSGFPCIWFLLVVNMEKNGGKKPLFFLKL